MLFGKPEMNKKSVKNKQKRQDDTLILRYMSEK